MDVNDSASAYAIAQLPNPAAPGSIPLVITFCVITFLTVLGNTLVISAVLLVNKLRCPSNFLIVSLAASDLLVSIMVMPFSTYREYRQYWGLGEVACDIFIVFDVLLCTASILNLCTISVDRFLAVTRPFEYAQRRTPKRMMIMIFIAWVISVLISVPPTFGFMDKFVPGKCEYSRNFFYQIYACLGAFYIPLIVMLILYGRIVILARRIVKSDRARVALTSGDEKRNSIQNYAESQDTEEATADDDKSKPRCLYFCNGCCFILGKRTSVDSVDKFLDPQLYINTAIITNVVNNVSRSHSNRFQAPTVSVIGVQDSPEPTPSDQVHHFSRLPPGKAHLNNTLTDEPVNDSDHTSMNVGFLTPTLQRPQSSFAKQHRTSLHPCAGSARGPSPLERERAYSLTVANLQAKPKRHSSTPLFSKQRLSIALHRKKSGIKRSNEAKAIRTLGIIMGVFCVCWLPFFVLALCRHIYNYVHNTEMNVDPQLSIFFLWLGYINSTLNPLIYAIFNREFRRPFWELMTCHCLNINARLRERRYQHEYRPAPVSLPTVSSGGAGLETPNFRRGRNSSHHLERRRSSVMTE